MHPCPAENGFFQTLLEVRVWYNAYVLDINFEKCTLSVDPEERPTAYYSHPCYGVSTSSTLFSKTTIRTKKIDEKWNMCFNEIYNFCLRHFFLITLFPEVNVRNNVFIGLMDIHFFIYYPKVNLIQHALIIKV